MKIQVFRTLTVLIYLFLQPVMGDEESVALRQIEYDLQLLKAEQVDLLYPEAFATLVKQFKMLQTRALPTSQVSQRATGLRLSTEINSWRLLGAKARREFTRTLEVRERCALMNGVEFAVEVFSAGDRKLLEAAQLFVKGDRNAMKLAAATAEKNYLKAELITIRNHLLGDIRIQFQEAETLNAKRYLPKSYQETKSLQREVETLQKNAAISNDMLYLKSQELANSTAKLLSLLYTVHRFRDDAGAAEVFLIGLLEKSELLTKKLDIPHHPEMNLQDQLQLVLEEVDELASVGEELISENKQLKNRHAEVRAMLLSYQTVSEREEFLASVLSKFSKSLSRPLKRQEEYITVQYDSLRYSDISDAGINDALREMLIPLAKALREFPSTDILLQLKLPQAESDIASRIRAERQVYAIKGFLQTRAGLGDEIRAFGEIYPISPDEPARSGQLMVVINIRELLSTAQLNSPVSGSASTLLKSSD